MILSFLCCGSQRGTAGGEGFYFSGLGELLPGSAPTAQAASPGPVSAVQVSSSHAYWPAAFSSSLGLRWLHSGVSPVRQFPGKSSLGNPRGWISRKLRRWGIIATVLPSDEVWPCPLKKKISISALPGTGLFLGCSVSALSIVASPHYFSSPIIINNSLH